jgi:hypothetical protein
MAATSSTRIPRARRFDMASCDLKSQDILCQVETATLKAVLLSAFRGSCSFIVARLLEGDQLNVRVCSS